MEVIAEVMVEDDYSIRRFEGNIKEMIKSGQDTNFIENHLKSKIK